MNEIDRYDTDDMGYHELYTHGDWCRYEDVEKLFDQSKKIDEIIKTLELIKIRLEIK